jgi:hypothetical protein
MDEDKNEKAAPFSAPSKFKVYLGFTTEQKKSVASALETRKEYDGDDDCVRKFIESILHSGALSPAELTEKEKIFALIAEDIQHR